MTPEAAMRRALTAARRSRGRTFPNPAVGAVVYRGDRVLATGSTRPVGGDHAEVDAIGRAVKRHGAEAVRGAAMAVTMEPCAFTGRTGPCTEALLDAGIARLLVGHEDPHPRVSGRGITRLRRGGVAVEVGILRDECAEQHRGFLSVVERGRPWVALKLAASLDGRIATASGESRWITGERARARVHRLRDRADAVVVGSGTARADDPSLDVRTPSGIHRRWPVRVLIDSGLRVSPKAHLYTDAGAERTWLLTRRGHGARARSSRTKAGARWIEAPTRAGKLDLARSLGRLADEGLTDLLVEGGGALAAALLRAHLVDELHWFAAPFVLGSDARPAIGALGLSRLGDRQDWEIRDVGRLGPDLYVQARRPGDTARPGKRKRGS